MSEEEAKQRKLKLIIKSSKKRVVAKKPTAKKTVCKKTAAKRRIRIKLPSHEIKGGVLPSTASTILTSDTSIKDSKK